jgi:hypothetical protein
VRAPSNHGYTSNLLTIVNCPWLYRATGTQLLTGFRLLPLPRGLPVNANFSRSDNSSFQQPVLFCTCVEWRSLHLTLRLLYSSSQSEAWIYFACQVADRSRQNTRPASAERHTLQSSLTDTTNYQHYGWLRQLITRRHYLAYTGQPSHQTCPMIWCIFSLVGRDHRATAP